MDYSIDEAFSLEYGDVGYSLYIQKADDGDKIAYVV